MSLKLDTSSRRIGFAIGISVLVHALALWEPDIRLPQFKPSLPPLAAKLEALPDAPARPRPKRKAKPAASKPVPEPDTQTGESPQPPQDAPPADNAPVETETLVAEAADEVERPPLPKHAQLTFAIHMGNAGLRVGETVHTLEINDGRYVLQAATKTVGLARLFKSYELNQYSNGSYGKYGLQPELFTEERKDRLSAQHIAVELDHEARRARFSNGREVALPEDTQDILSVMYQFPPLAHTEMVGVSISNGRKIEHYEFVIANEEIDTVLGRLLTVRLHKMHAPNEEGLDIWLAREYRLFPVKLRFIEKNGEVSGEAVITDIHVSEEQGVRSDAVN